MLLNQIIVLHCDWDASCVNTLNTQHALFVVVLHGKRSTQWYPGLFIISQHTQHYTPTIHQYCLSVEGHRRLQPILILTYSVGSGVHVCGLWTMGRRSGYSERTRVGTVRTKLNTNSGIESRTFLLCTASLCVSAHPNRFYLMDHFISFGQV